MKSTRRELTETAILSALYAAITIVLQPISYLTLQFRVAEVLKGGAVKYRSFVWMGFLGNFLANLVSPVGAIDALVGPLVSGGGCVCAYLIGRYSEPAANLINATIVGVGIGSMLAFVFALPLWIPILSVLVAELVLIAGFGPLIKQAYEKVDTKGL